MSGSEWDDEEGGYAPAPLPLHERTWRHPSELGESSAVPGPSLGRSSLIGAGVIGVALVVGLTQLLVPRSGTTVVSTQATLALAGRSSSSASARDASSGTSALRSDPATTNAPSATRIRPTDAPSTAPSSAAAAAIDTVSTVRLVAAGRAAVPFGDGRRAVTTAGDLAEHDTLEVRLGDGTSVPAVVISVDTEGNVAVLQLDERATGRAATVATELPHDGDHVVVGCATPTDAVLVETSAGMVVEIDASVEDGAPILDREGALLGLASTRTDGLVLLVPIIDVALGASADTSVDLDDMLVITVWLGVSFEGEDLVIASVQDGAPAYAAGVLAGDRLLSLDGLPLSTIDDLWLALSGYDPNDVVTLLIESGRVQRAVTVTLGARPS